MSTPRMFRWVYLGLTLSVLPLAVGCDGCSGKAKTGSPLQFIAADADAVLEIRDIGLLIRARQGATQSFGSLLPKAQIESLQKELQLSLGFDPSTAEGLAKAGLPAKGAIAANILSSGKGAVWVFPVADPVKLKPLLQKVLQSRVSIDATRIEKIGPAEVTVFETQFGADKLTVAAHVFSQGYVLVALGRDALDLLKGALSVKPEASVARSAEYAALIKSLDTNWDVRMTSPKGGETLKGALRTASRSVPEAKALIRDELTAVKGVGWSATFSARGLTVQGSLRLDEKGLALSKKVFAPEGAPDSGVKAVGVPQSVMFAQVGLHAKTVLDLIAPVGSPARARIDRASDRAQKDLSLDIKEELIPLLTGHGAVALGLGGLDKLSFKELMGNPRGALWTAFGLGVKDPAAAVALEKRLDPGLKARTLEIVTRTVAEQTVRSVVPPKDPISGAQAPLVETSGFGGAWVFANEPALMDQVIKNTTAANALGGDSGVYVEVNFRELNTQLSAFRYGDLPILYRSLLAKVMDGLKLLDSAKIRVQPVAEGVSLNAELNILPLTKAK